MVQAIENWTCVSGRVMHVSHADGRAVLAIEVTGLRAVEGFRSFVKADAGDALEVVISHGVDLDSVVDRHITIPVRMARPGLFFAATDWSPDKGSPRCPPED